MKKVRSLSRVCLFEDNRTCTFLVNLFLLNSFAHLAVDKGFVVVVVYILWIWEKEEGERYPSDSDESFSID